MPASHQFNRRIAAIGAALALVALPISSTFTPAIAQPSPSASVEGGSTGTADTEAAAGSDGADSSSGADASGGSGDSADSDPKATDAGADSGDTNGSDDSEPDPDKDGACANRDDGKVTPGVPKPCAIEGSLKAKWHEKSKTLSVPKNNNDTGSLPKTWVGVEFDGPKQTMVRIPAQASSADGNTGSRSSDSDTDDSGRSVADATAQADVPKSFKFDKDGVIRDAGTNKPMKFEKFNSDPKWKFTANGKKIIAEGKKYPDSNDGDSGSSNSTSNQNGDKNAGIAATEDGSKDDDGSSNTSANGNADRSNSESNASRDSSGDEDGASSNSRSSSNSKSSSNSNSASNSKSKDQSNSASEDDGDGKNSNSDSGARSDGSHNSDSDSSGSGSHSSSKDDDGNDSDDPDGSPVGTADGDNTTPDPSNGNGSKDDERETIPGTAGDEWLPGDEDNSERPDYSDPVPQNPDAPTPKDDTDLITGGDKPSPRANQQPSSFFGESIVSTIVSSWPVFVLAASGMAAVGFIIYIMGRRSKQD